MTFTEVAENQRVRYVIDPLVILLVAGLAVRLAPLLARAWRAAAAHTPVPAQGLRNAVASSRRPDGIGEPDRP
jgi:hypothetical protein